MPGYLDNNSNLSFGWAAGEDTWGPAMNRSLRQMAYAGLNPTVKNSTTSTPPTSPTLGDKYIVAAGPTGAWSTYNANDIAVWGRGLVNPATPAWQRFQPQKGWVIYNEATDNLVSYNGSAWVLASGAGESNVQSDWTETDTASDAFIQNKPEIPDAIWKDATPFRFNRTLTAGVPVNNFRIGSLNLNPIGTRLPGLPGYGLRIRIDENQTYTVPANTTFTYSVSRPDGRFISINNASAVDPRDSSFISTLPAGADPVAFSNFIVSVTINSGTGGAIDVTFIFTGGPKLVA